MRSDPGRSARQVPSSVDTTDGAPYFFFVWAAIGASGVATLAGLAWLWEVVS